MTSLPFPLSSGDFEDASRANDGWDPKYREQFVKESILRQAKEYAERSGPEAMRQRRHDVEDSLRTFNRVFGGSTRLSIPTIEAMITMLASIPPSCGMDIINRRGYVEMTSIFHAIRLELIAERDHIVMERMQNPLTFPQAPDGENKPPVI